MSKPPQEQLKDALTQVALLESRSFLSDITEVVRCLERQEYTAACETFLAFADTFHFVGTVLHAVSRLPGNQPTLTN